MKKFLAALMAVMLTAVMVLSFAVCADGEETAPAQTDEAQVTEGDADNSSASEEIPDTSSIKQTLIFDFTKDPVVVSQKIMGESAALKYIQNQYSAGGAEVTLEKDEAGQEVLTLPDTELPVESLASTGIDIVEDKGLLSTKKTYVYLIGTLNGGTEGEEIGKIVFKLNDHVSYTNAVKVKGGVEKALISGQNGTVIVMTNAVNWIGIILIVLIILAILVIVALILIASSRKKNANKADEEADGFVSEENIFEQLANEVKQDAEEMVEEPSEEPAAETVEEPVLEESAEEKTEE